MDLVLGIKSDVDRIMGMLEERLPGPSQASQEMEEDGEVVPSLLDNGESVVDDVSEDEDDDATSVASSTDLAPLASQNTLDVNVSKKHVKEILKGEFFDLTLLMPFKQDSVWVAEPKGEGMSFAKKKPSAERITFDHWLRAFMTYMSVWVKCHQQDSAPMLKHMSNVIDVKEEGGDWLDYDTKFRKRRAKLHWSWAEFDSETYNKASRKQKPPSSQTNSHARPASKRAGQSDICYSFQKGECTGRECPKGYAHRCMRCNGEHPRSRCYKRLYNTQTKYTRITKPNGTTPPNTRASSNTNRSR